MEYAGTFHLKSPIFSLISAQKILNSAQLFKLVTDEQVFFDKFLCDKFYLPSVRVYIQQVLYEKFSYDKFYLLVWTCQKKVFIVAMAEKI